MLCDYSEILGKVREGIHSYRVFDIAVLDVLGTIIGSYLLQKNFFREYTVLQVTVSTFIIGIILHRLFCVKTTVDKLLFSE